MKYEIMVRILFLLLARGKVTAKYIAHRFDISIRTALRYLDALSLAGIPIISEAGRNGGYYISETYRLPASFLTKNEFNRVIATLSSCNEQLGSSELNSALEKLCAINKDGYSVDFTYGNLIIDGSSWSSGDNTKSVLSLINSAVEEKTVVRIKYIDKQGVETLREIEPHVIILKQGSWYVYAYCALRKDFRMFKLARIMFADKTEKNFVKRDNDFGPDKLVDWFGELPTEFIDLEVDNSAKADVEEWLGVDSVYKTTPSKLYVSAKLPYDNWLISRILGFGNKVKVLSPEKLKSDVKNAALGVINLY